MENITFEQFILDRILTPTKTAATSRILTTQSYLFVGTDKHHQHFHRLYTVLYTEEKDLGKEDWVHIMDHLNTLAVCFLVIIFVVSGEPLRLSKLKPSDLARSYIEKVFFIETA